MTQNVNVSNTFMSHTEYVGSKSEKKLSTNRAYRTGKNIK